jgi:acetyl-CoA synthetase
MATAIGAGVPECVGRYPGYYLTGDGCRRDGDGHWWITGRVDEVLNVAGYRLGAGEIEAALREHPGCAEAAVVGMAHALKGTAIAAFVVARAAGAERELAAALTEQVRRAIGAFARPERVVVVAALPKTRSGKIMRRLLADVLAGRAPGDVSALADPEVLAGVVRAVAGQAGDG